MSDALNALGSLAKAMGVHTQYIDGLGKPIIVGTETLVRVCSALGAPLSTAADATDALRALQAREREGLVPPVMVAWDGAMQTVPVLAHGPVRASLRLENGDVIVPEITQQSLGASAPIPLGYHTLTVEADGRREESTVIAAPLQAWRRPGSKRSWGLSAQLAALRSARSRAVGDLQDLRALCEWMHERGGDLVTVLPLLPTFNHPPAEPSPYSPVSRLFWSELILDLGARHQPVGAVETLDVTRADAEVRAALAGSERPQAGVDDELARYARFRGAQAVLGRNWREWPAETREGDLGAPHVDENEERFHLVAQLEARRQLEDLRRQLHNDGFRLGLDLAVGVHPDGYDPWSRQSLFANSMSVGAPPDLGFPSGQDWGFSPVLPTASRREGHRYVAASIGHQASLAGVLRIDHIMAWTRLYWIPHGQGLHQGTYVSYPAEELFAVLTLESHRHECEVVGENLGTVPPEIDQALPRHRIWGMYLAEFQGPPMPELVPPTAQDVAMIGTHDTPPFAGFLAGDDILERVNYRLLKVTDVADVTEERMEGAQWLAEQLGGSLSQPRALLEFLLDWLGRSPSPLVATWLEDLWLERRNVNLPGTPSSVRPNWQRPMAKLLDDMFRDPGVDDLVRRLNRARSER